MFVPRPDQTAGQSLAAGLPASRRTFLAGLMASGGAFALAGAIPEAAQAASSVNDCYNGLAAFVMPGNDRFSIQQGAATRLAGGVEAGAGTLMQRTLDNGVSLGLGAQTLRLPGAAGIAVLIGNFAVQVSLRSAAGPFSHPFANLKLREKREVLMRLDASPLLEGTPLAYVGGTITTLAAICAWSEGTARSRATGSLTRRPVGYERSSYQGIRDGEADFIGFYQDRTKVDG